MEIPGSSKRSKAFDINCEADIQKLERYITANNPPGKKPETPTLDKHEWAMLDSGSAHNVAYCKKHFPDHDIREPRGQNMGIPT